MSTIKVNTITKVNGDPVLSGRVVTLSQYNSNTYSNGGVAPKVIDSFSFVKKHSSALSKIIGIFCVSNLQEGNQAQRYTVYRGGVQYGFYRLRHSLTGWSMSLDSFTWEDTAAGAGTLTYDLRIEEYVSQFYYNYPTTLTGSPNANSTFTIMEVLL
jgi:hypothetical protein